MNSMRVTAEVRIQGSGRPGALPPDQTNWLTGSPVMLNFPGLRGYRLGLFASISREGLPSP